MQIISMIVTFLVRTAEWLITSSKDNTKLSATSIGFAVYAFVSLMAGHFALGPEDVKAMTDGIDNFALTLGQLLSAGYTLWGAYRKVKTTVTGENAVIAGWVR